MAQYPYFGTTPKYPYNAVTTNPDNNGGRKKAALLYALLCYLAIGFGVAVVLFVSDTGILTSSCDAGTCPTSIAELIGNLVRNMEFWLDVIVWPAKLIVFLTRAI